MTLLVFNPSLCSLLPFHPVFCVMSQFYSHVACRNFTTSGAQLGLNLFNLRFIHLQPDVFCLPLDHVQRDFVCYQEACHQLPCNSDIL